MGALFTQVIDKKQPFTNDPRTNWKYIAIVVVFAILVSGGTIWFTQSSKSTPSQTISIPKTPSPPKQQIDTSTWQTYRNDEFGFEMKYPKSWLPEVIEEKPDIFGNSLFRVAIVEPNNDWWPANIDISVYPAKGYFAPEAVDIQGWISDHAPKTPLGDNLLKETTKGMLDNRSARITSMFSFDSRKRVIIVGAGSYIYTVSFDESTPNDPKLDEHLKTYDQILSTFRFLP